MSLEENKALVRRFVDEVYNDGNVAAIPNYLRAGTLLAGSIEVQNIHSTLASSPRAVGLHYVGVRVMRFARLRALC